MQRAGAAAAGEIVARYPEHSTRGAFGARGAGQQWRRRMGDRPCAAAAGIDVARP